MQADLSPLESPNGLAFAAYRLATRLAPPILRHMLRKRVKRGKEIAARLPEREGIDAASRPAGKLIWMHAASIGETVCVLPLLRHIVTDAAILFTTGTRTSAGLLEKWLDENKLRGRIAHRFVPLDAPQWAERFVAHWRPDAAIFVESELWPNLLAACRQHDVRIALVNGRMSAQSLKGWRRLPGLVRSIVRSFDWIQARSEEDAARWRELGAERFILAGDLKFAAPALPVRESEWRAMSERYGDRAIWLAASTHDGEETVIAAAHDRLIERWPDLITIIVPRHPERGGSLSAQFGWPRRAKGDFLPDEGGIYLADTIGELGLWYRMAPIVFIGKTLHAPGGGQNPLEAARLGCALAIGPHSGNFEEAVDALRKADALESVTSADDLAIWVDAMLGSSEDRLKRGNAARKAAQSSDHLPEALGRAIRALANPA